MTKRLGPRGGLEVGFLLGVAVVLGLLEVSWPVIVAALAVAWLLVAAAEILLSRESPPEAVEETVETPSEPAPPAVPEPPVIPSPVPVPPVPEPEPEPGPEPEPEPEPEPGPEPEPEPEPPPPPAPVAEPEPPEPMPPPPAVETPREWNLWELERIAREQEGLDPARDEERAFLLLSLRDFARPNGDLPLEFDQLVRDAFGDLLRTAA